MNIEILKEFYRNVQAAVCLYDPVTAKLLLHMLLATLIMKVTQATIYSSIELYIYNI